jgi:hypothetical protein
MLYQPLDLAFRLVIMWCSCSGDNERWANNRRGLAKSSQVSASANCVKGLSQWARMGWDADRVALAIEIEPLARSIRRLARKLFRGARSMAE